MQSKTFVIRVMHTNTSYLYIVFLLSLFQIHNNVVYGKHLILPAQGTNTRNGSRALTITAISFIVVALSPPT